MHDIDDKRLLQRVTRKGEILTRDPGARLESLPDLASNLREPGEEEVMALRQELAEASSARAERIQRQLQEDRSPRPQALPPVTPFDAEL